MRLKVDSLLKIARNIWSKAKIRKGSKTTYGMWCDKHKFLYADKDVPQDWIEEKKKPAKQMPSDFINFPLKKIKR